MKSKCRFRSGKSSFSSIYSSARQQIATRKAELIWRKLFPSLPLQWFISTNFFGNFWFVWLEMRYFSQGDLEVRSFLFFSSFANREWMQQKIRMEIKIDSILSARYTCIINHGLKSFIIVVKFWRDTCDQLLLLSQKSVTTDYLSQVRSQFFIEQREWNPLKIRKHTANFSEE